MAPVLACCLLSMSLPLAFVILLFISLLITNCNSTLVYDRLLDIRSAVADFTKSDVSGPCLLPLPFSIHLPAHLCRCPMDRPRRKRRRRRSKRGGFAVRLKTGSNLGEWYTASIVFVGRSAGPWTPSRKAFPESQVQQPFAIIPVSSSMHHFGMNPHIHRGGVNLHNLRPLCLITQLESDSSAVLKMEKSTHGPW